MNATATNDAAPDFEQFRSYLRLQAEMQLSPRLKVKEAASDIVQQAMLEAHRDLKDFRGKTDVELRAWLRVILTNNLTEVARRYHTQQRTIRREVSLKDQLEQSRRFRLQRDSWLQSGPGCVDYAQWEESTDF